MKQNIVIALDLIYRSKLIKIGTPDELKEQAKTTQNPSPTLEDAFIALIQQYDEEHTCRISLPIPH